MNTPNDTLTRLGVRLATGIALSGPTQSHVTPYTAHRRVIESRMPPQVVVAMTSVRLSTPTELLRAVFQGTEPVERLGDVIAMLRAAADTLEAGLAAATPPCSAQPSEA